MKIANCAWSLQKSWTGSFCFSAPLSYNGPVPTIVKAILLLALNALIAACTVASDPLPPPTATSIPTDTPTPISSPEPTALPPVISGSDPLSQGMIARRNGDYGRAAAAFQATLNSNPSADVAREAQFRLGEAYWLDHDDDHAVNALKNYLQANPQGAHVPETHYFLSDAYRSLKDYPDALSELRVYRTLTQTLAGDTDGGIGDLLVLIGDSTQALAAYDRGLQDNTVSTATKISILQRAADVHTGRGESDLAAARYDAALALATDARTRADLDVKAGEAYAAAHQMDQARARWNEAVSKYPEQPGAFQSLIDLLDYDFAVDSFQRGYVDYNAASYNPAIDAFRGYLQSNSARAGEAHYYIARSYARQGLYSRALAEYDTVIKSYPKDKRASDAYMGKASSYAALGRTDDAVATYKRFAAAFPADAQADDALWNAALLLDRAKRYDAANNLYEQLQTKYPGRERAAEALFWAGLDYYRLQDYKTASARWQSITKNYSQSPFFARALFWLGKAAQARGLTDAAKNYWKQASTLPVSYYTARAADVLSPGSNSPVYDLSAYAMDKPSDRAEFEKWLASWAKPTLGTAGTLDAATRADLRFRRGTELVRLDRTVEARREFTSLIADKNDEPGTLYALALYLRDNNLFSLSMDCAERIARLAASASAPDAPRLLWALRYPTYYADLVVPEAKANQLDPLLYFALIRQESGFNARATSSADARGLAQVIPSTAREIAQRLGVRNFSLDQLYLPYVSVRFGVWYFGQDMKQFDNPIYALAAYNAGAGRTAKWEKADLDMAVEDIDSSQANLYVRLVYGYWRQYQQIYK